MRYFSQQLEEQCSGRHADSWMVGEENKETKQVKV